MGSGQTAEDGTPPRSGLRPRLSLLNLLLITTVIAMGLGLFFSWRAITPLKEEIVLQKGEIYRLQKEAVSIADRLEVTHNKLHVNRLESKSDDMRKSWSVWIPMESAYRLVLSDQAFLSDNYPPGDVTIPLGSTGEIDILLETEFDEDTDRLTVTVSSGWWTKGEAWKENQTRTLNFKLPASRSVEATGTPRVHRGTWVFDDDQRADLVRVCWLPSLERAREIRGSEEKGTLLLPGLMLWLEPVTEQP